MPTKPPVKRPAFKLEPIKPPAMLPLGSTVRDSITGFTGKMVARTEWINGCLRYLIQPTTLKDGKTIEPESFDSQQVDLVEESAAVPPAKPTGGPCPSPTRAKDPK